MVDQPDQGAHSLCIQCSPIMLMSFHARCKVFVLPAIRISCCAEQSVYDDLELDGIWIDMNEPSNYCTGDVCWNDGWFLIPHCFARMLLESCGA